MGFGSKNAKLIQKCFSISSWGFLLFMNITFSSQFPKSESLYAHVVHFLVAVTFSIYFIIKIVNTYFIWHQADTFTLESVSHEPYFRIGIYFSRICCWEVFTDTVRSCCFVVCSVTWWGSQGFWRAAQSQTLFRAGEWIAYRIHGMILLL